MADTKPPASRKIPVATPTIPSSASSPALGPTRTPSSSTTTVPLEAALSTCIGALVRITTTLPPSSPITGTIFTVSPLANLLCLNTTAPPPTPAPSSAANQPGDYHILPLSSLASFQVLSLPPASRDDSAGAFARAQPALKPLDLPALRRREKLAIDAELKRERARGRGVGRDAQDIYDALARTLPVRWQDSTIVVLDSVAIRAPGYGVDDVRGDDKGVVARVRKVLEMERRKLAERSRAGTPTGSGKAPAAGVRKGG